MGSESKNDGGGGGNGGAQIPAAAKKIVQSLREILSNKPCTDAEIYAVLRDCNMDPNDAVQRLLSQDTFHEVKSKRERRKEMKETRELKAQVNDSNANRGGYNVGHASSASHLNYNDNGKAVYWRENGLAASVPSSTLMYRVKTSNEQPSPHSGNLSSDSTREYSENEDRVSLSGPPPAATHVTWHRGTSNSGHVTMADIVRMGKPPSRDSQTAVETTHVPEDSDSQFSSFYHLKPSHDSSSSQMGMRKDHQCADSANESKMIQESFIANSEHNFTNEWPCIEQQTAASGSSILNKSTISSIDYDGTKFPERIDADVAAENTSSIFLVSASPSGKPETLDVGAAEGIFNRSLSEDVMPYDFHQYMHKHEGGISNSFSPPANDNASLKYEVSSTSVDFQKLGKEEPRMPISEHNSAVVFPNYMQALNADLSHLSFGTYKSGARPTVSESLTSDPLQNRLEEGSTLDSASAAAYDARNSEYVDQILRDGQLGLNTDSRDNVFPQSRRPSIPQAPNAYEYVPSSIPDSNYRNMENLRSVATNPNARNPPLDKELQSSSMPVSIDLMASAVQSLRDSDHAHSSLLGKQSASSRYRSVVSSSVDPAISMSEALNSSAFSLPKSYSSALPSVSPAMGSALPQHMAALAHSQPKFSLEELASLTGYPSISENHARNLSALQHSYQDIGVLHDSSAGMKRSVPQFGGGAFRSSLPLSDSIVFHDRDLGTPTNLSGRFLHDIPSTRSGSAVGYDGIQSQYNEELTLAMLQQARNSHSSAWDYGPSMRAASNVLDGRNYSLPAQNQLLSGYPQSQQHMQNYDALGYTNIYHSQAGTIRDQQQEGLGSLPFTSQAQPYRPPHQFWQQRY